MEKIRHPLTGEVIPGWMVATAEATDGFLPREVENEVKILSRKEKRKAKRVVKAETFSIPKGNAQLVYSIQGDPGEEFEVTRAGTMVPPGKYKVVETDVNKRTQPWGTFSEITVEKIGSVEEKEAVTPPGWEGTVRKMKNHPEITNPWALAWWMKGKGYKPKAGSREKVAYDEKDLLDIAENRMGWAVAEQLKHVLEGKPFDDQNPNALRMISDFLKGRDDEELADWAAEIDEYLNKPAEASKKEALEVELEFDIDDPELLKRLMEEFHKENPEVTASDVETLGGEPESVQEAKEGEEQV